MVVGGLNADTTDEPRPLVIMDMIISCRCLSRSIFWRRRPASITSAEVIPIEPIWGNQLAMARDDDSPRPPPFVMNKTLLMGSIPYCG